MSLFHYTAMRADGERVRGVLAGESAQAVIVELEARALTPVAVEATAGRVRAARVSARKLGEAYGQLADLLHAGVPLLRALKLLGQRRSAPRLAAVFRDLSSAVEKGSDLAAAMEAAPGVFAPVHVAMVRAGEKGGFLESVLARLGALVTKQAELRSRIIGNLIYPAILVVLGLVIGGVIFGVFVPKFRPMLSRLKELPALTELVFAASDAVSKHGLLTLALALALAGVAWRVLKLPAWRERAERWKLRAPVVGRVVRGLAAARFCQLLGAMLSNGVPMLAALRIAKSGTGNMLMERAVDKASDAVRAGEPLAAPLGQSGLFDDDVVEMITVGEQANNLDAVLVKVGDTLEARLDRQVGVAVRLVEPLLLVLLAAVIGAVAAALLLPMSKLSGGV